MSLKRNVIANYLGQGWRAVMMLAFVPVYIRYLGIEAYGLIGVFAVLQAWMTMLDMGMRPSLTREMARYTGGAIDIQSIRDLLRSVEVLAVLFAAAATAAVWALSGWLAREWLTARTLDPDTVVHAVTIMGAVAALRFIEAIYVGALTGLQRQVVENAASSVLATVRALGAVAVLAWVAPTIRAFFIWQAVISLLSVLTLAAITHASLPRAPRPARFSRASLESIARFAAGMMLITTLSLLLTQVDKMLLSRLLTLESFGYYALAGTVAGSLPTLAMPISTAFYPRLVEFAAQRDDDSLRVVYHLTAQLLTVCCGTAAVLLVGFGDPILEVWTGDAALSGAVAPLLAVLALGTMLNVLMWPPYHLQLAHGWTGLMVRVNTVAVAILVPAILLFVPRYGALGAAWVWVGLNAGYVIFAVRLMHRRLLKAEMWRWYRQDVALPLAAAVAAAWVWHLLLPRTLPRMAQVAFLVFAGGCVLTVAALAAPLVRQQIALRLPEFLRRS